jgi:hypothetical protein
MKPKDIPKVQAKIVEWVKKNAAELHAEVPKQPSEERPYGYKNRLRG